MSWTLVNPCSIGMATKKAHYDALWDNCDMFKTEHGTDGKHTKINGGTVAAALHVEALSYVNQDLTSDASPTFAGLTASGLTASLPVFTGTSKELVSKSVANANSALGLGTTDTPFFANLNLSGMTASLPVFTDGSKYLVSKSIADTLTKLGIGAWTDYTPSLKFGGYLGDEVYAVQRGSYFKIEKLVIITGIITLSSKGSGAGPLAITMNGDTANQDAAVSLVASNLTFANQVFGKIIKGGDRINLWESTEAGTATELTAADLSNTTSISFTAIFRSLV
jgi:hypothetical protein